MENKLHQILDDMVRKEKKAKEFKSRVRVKGRIIKKSLTKKGNIRIRVKKGDGEFNFVVMKSHKERYELAKKLIIGSNVHAQGIKKLGMVICTKLRKIERVDESKQSKLNLDNIYK